MVSVRWAKPLAVLIALFLAGALVPRAAAVSPVKQCIRGCKKQQGECIRQIKDRFNTLKAECAGLTSGSEIKICKKIHRKEFKTNRKECKKLRRKACKPWFASSSSLVRSTTSSSRCS